MAGRATTLQRGRDLAAWLVAVLALTACGSTVQLTAVDGVAGDTTLDALDATPPDGSESAATPPESGTAAPGLPTQPGPSSPGQGIENPGAPSEQRTSFGPGPGAGPATGRGFTQDEIYVGYATAQTASQVFGSFGIALDAGDTQAQAQAVIDDINARGGVAGRNLVPVFYDFGAQSLQNPSGAAEAACSHWTQDNQVHAVITVLALGTGDDTLSSCLAARDTPLISMAPQLRPAAAYARFSPYLHAPANASMERFVPRWLQRAQAIGYFEGWNTTLGQPGNVAATIGVISNTNLFGRDFLRNVTDELERLGHSVESTFDYSGQLATTSSEMNAAVLRFKSRGVTHVITAQSFEPFAQAAESQAYRPRYVVSSFHNPAFAQTIAPASQLNGAVGAGFLPTLDVDAAHDPGDVSATQTRCRSIMEDAGQSTTSRQALSLMVTACDGFFFLAQAIEEGGLTSQGLAAGARAMGSMEAASTFAISFSGGRLDGAAAVRDLRFDSGCRCFVYASTSTQAM